MRRRIGCPALAVGFAVRREQRIGLAVAFLEELGAPLQQRREFAGRPPGVVQPPLRFPVRHVQVVDRLVPYAGQRIAHFVDLFEVTVLRRAVVPPYPAVSGIGVVGPVSLPARENRRQHPQQGEKPGIDTVGQTPRCDMPDRLARGPVPRDLRPGHRIAEVGHEGVERSGEERNEQKYEDPDSFPPRADMIEVADYIPANACDPDIDDGNAQGHSDAACESHFMSLGEKDSVQHRFHQKDEQSDSQPLSDPAALVRRAQDPVFPAKIVERRRALKSKIVRVPDTLFQRAKRALKICFRLCGGLTDVRIDDGRASRALGVDAGMFRGPVEALPPISVYAVDDRQFVFVEIARFGFRQVPAAAQRAHLRQFHVGGDAFGVDRRKNRRLFLRRALPAENGPDPGEHRGSPLAIPGRSRNAARIAPAQPRVNAWRPLPRPAAREPGRAAHSIPRPAPLSNRSRRPAAVLVVAVGAPTPSSPRRGPATHSIQRGCCWPVFPTFFPTERKITNENS